MTIDPAPEPHHEKLKQTQDKPRKFGNPSISTPYDLSTRYLTVRVTYYQGAKYILNESKTPNCMSANLSRYHNSSMHLGPLGQLWISRQQVGVLPLVRFDSRVERRLSSWAPGGKQLPAIFGCAPLNSRRGGSRQKKTLRLRNSGNS